MPESPEVQALADELGERLHGRAFSGGEFEEFRVLKTPARPLASVAGRSVARVRRFGKHVDLEMDDGSHLVVSFGRAGWAAWAPVAADAPAPVVAHFAFDGADLELTDAGAWLSLGVSVVDDPSEVSTIAKLGADPLAPGYSRADFDRVVGSRRKQVKALLQEQESFAGIGNAYSDEILHTAKIAPLAHAAALSGDERDRLYEAVVSVMGDATAARRGIPIDQLKAEKVASMRVHGRTGEACPVCGTTIEDLPGASGSSSAQYCPFCQSEPA
ncbi:DNA-formamidopyrimidine glycosylase family protein [Microbacterium sp. ASV49]|uniref:DNA-formamidopyrimidine glycosylase family protein n=1 Tax=Microbacterium candidum TaxID=3041922 RepID=A0ABT7N2B1_9MICO|nr:DNA-formamidopyrimidine glycosylase family protein [Microbacterium sp. ASV49]MDL9980822.1 DNA-formamidopyrimidine glycosylase family protein [Microbacterium sp. ASV49]